MTRTILHIDDDALFRRVMRRVFESSGWTVIEAEHGEEGARTAKVEAPQLILLDIRMPIQDGFQTLQVLKQMEATAGIPVVMCSSLGSKEDIQFCLQTGAVGYLVKAHHHPEEIRAYVERLLGNLPEGYTE